MRGDVCNLTFRAGRQARTALQGWTNCCDVKVCVATSGFHTSIVPGASPDCGSKSSGPEAPVMSISFVLVVSAETAALKLVEPTVIGFPADSRLIPSATS